MGEVILLQAPRSPRQVVKSADSPMRIVVEREPNRQPSCLHAELLDISASGAKVRIDYPVQFHESLTLRLESADPPLKLAIATCVRHLQQGEENNWTFGCAFEPRLPQSELDELFSQGLLERRAEVRIPIAVTASIRWELEQEPTTVELIDFSRGGFCIISPKLGQVGARLRLQPDVPGGGGPDILATARWQADSQLCYMIGCVFIRQGYSQLLELTTVQGPPATSGGVQGWLRSLNRLRAGIRNLRPPAASEQA